jgi:hypothetical protein
LRHKSLRKLRFAASHVAQCSMAPVHKVKVLRPAPFWADPFARRRSSQGEER